MFLLEGLEFSQESCHKDVTLLRNAAAEEMKKQLVETQWSRTVTKERIARREAFTRLVAELDRIRKLFKDSPVDFRQQIDKALSMLPTPTTEVEALQMVMHTIKIVSKETAEQVLLAGAPITLYDDWKQEVRSPPKKKRKCVSSETQPAPHKTPEKTAEEDIFGKTLPLELSPGMLSTYVILI